MCDRAKNCKNADRYCDIVATAGDDCFVSAASPTDLLNAKFGNDAIQCCIDIYMDYHVSEIRKLPPATRAAWELGQKARFSLTQR